jgi:hypothetical protein
MGVVKGHVPQVFQGHMTFTGRPWHGHMTVLFVHRLMNSHKKRIARCGVILEMGRQKLFSEGSKISVLFLDIRNSGSCHGHSGATVVVAIGLVV